MSTRRILISLIVTLAIVTMVTSYVGQSRKGPQTADNRMNQRRIVEPDKEAAIKSRLAMLLVDEGLHLTDTSLNPESGTYREARVRWETAEDSAAIAASPVQQRLGSARTVALSSKRSGNVPRQRSLELSTEQLLVIGVGDNSQALWWHTLVDPRLLRSEAPGVTGEIKNENLYLPRVDFAITYPDGAGIKALRLYHPVWNGKEFQLQLVGILSVAD